MKPRKCTTCGKNYTPEPLEKVEGINPRCTACLERAAQADWIQETVIARAAKLGLSSYAIAKSTAGAVSEDHARDYLTRRKSMGSHKLQHVLRVLGLDLHEIAKR